jgi:hypothetical protein
MISIQITDRFSFEIIFEPLALKISTTANIQFLVFLRPLLVQIYE